MLNKALDIAYKAHWGQTDKAGTPYKLHPTRVALHCQTEDEKIVALLHDVVEDTSMTLEELKAQGFSNEVLAALKCLTQIEDEDYQNIHPTCSNQSTCRKSQNTRFERQYGFVPFGW